MAERLHPPDHHHHHHEHEPVISKRWKWLTVLGNAAIGAAELVTGNLSTLSVASDGLHNVGDTATYYIQAENILNPNLTERRKKKMRKLAHWAIALTSLGVSAKAGYDLALDQEHAPNPTTIYAAYASLALNGLMLARLRRGMRNKGSHHSEHEHDIAKHFWAVDIPSAGLAVAGAALQRYNVDIEQAAAVASGLVGAYAFRPTEKNLTHNCLDHEHHSAPTPKQPGRLTRWFESRQSPERRPSRLKMAVGLGAAALAMVGGLLSGDTQEKNTVHATPDIGNTPGVTQTLPDLPQPPVQAAQVMECATIAPGDSQWKIISQRIEAATGKQASVAEANAITMFTAVKNKAALPDPSSITAGDCLQVPTFEATRLLSRTLDQPNLAGSAMQRLNHQSDMQDVLDEDAAVTNITHYLQQTLTTV